MVAEPCATPDKGACRIGSRDPFEKLDGAASIVFQQLDLEDSSTHARVGSYEERCPVVDDEDQMFTISGEDMEYLESHMEEILHPYAGPQSVEWLGRIEFEEAARIINAHPLPERSSK